MANEHLEIPAWIEEAVRGWEHSFEQPESVKERWKALARANLEALGKIDREKLTGWRRGWIEWLLETNVEAASGDAEEKIDLLELVNEDTPEWLFNVEKKLAESAMSTVNFKALMQGRPSQTLALTFGEIVGHEHAIWHPDNSGLEMLTNKLHSQELKALQKEFTDYQRGLRLAWVGQAMEIAKRQSFKEWQQFSRGYSLAIQRGTLDETGHFLGETLSTKILQALDSFSDFVPRLKSTKELYEWLQSLLGRQLLDDRNGHKRVEKICESIKLHLASPGRPKKQ